MLIPEFSWEMAEETFKKLRKVGRWLDELCETSVTAGPSGPAGGAGPQEAVEMVDRAWCPWGQARGADSTALPHTYSRKADREVRSRRPGHQKPVVPAHPQT